MDKRDILLIIIVLILSYTLYELNNIKKIEGFYTTTTATTQEQINNAVKKFYLADVEAIRLLSNFAIQLSQGGTTVPGNVTFSGNVTANGYLNTNNTMFANNNLYAQNRIYIQTREATDAAGGSLWLINLSKRNKNNNRIY